MKFPRRNPSETHRRRTSSAHRALTLGVVAIAAVGVAACQPVTPGGEPVVPAGPAAFPSAATTGVPAGVTLKSSGSITVSKAGTVIDGLDVRGTIRITADNVTIKRTRVTGAALYPIQANDNAKNIRIEDVEIDGFGNSTTGIRGGGLSVVRTEITGVENGIEPFNDSVIAGSWIHGLKNSGSPHYDGITIDGSAKNILIAGNFIDMRSVGQTATVMIDNYFGPVNNVVVTGNRLLGGGCTVYSDGQFGGGSITGVQFTNNRMGKGYWCYTSFNRNTPVFTNNIDDTTGATVRAGS